MRGKAGSTPRQFEAWVSLPCDSKGKPVWPDSAVTWDIYRFKSDVIRVHPNRIYRLVQAPPQKRKKKR